MFTVPKDTVGTILHKFKAHSKAWGERIKSELKQNFMLEDLATLHYEAKLYRNVVKCKLRLCFY